MSGWRVIGIGSPFGDDRAGWVVLEQLAQHSLPENVELILIRNKVSEHYPEI
jgi:Ni,Fe-hydrogenase maturation factor